MFKALNAQSIAARLFLSAAFWSSTILVVAGLGLTAIHARSTEAAFDEQLGVYLKALVANVAAAGDEAHGGPGQFIDPQFELARSGWYWQITRLDSPQPDIKSSRSLFAAQLPRLDAARPTQPESGAVRSGYVVGPDDRSLRMIERVIDAGDEGRYLIQVAGNSEEIEAEIDDFEYALAATFVLLLAAILGSMALAVRFGLRPLRELREGVAAIRRGEAEHISGDFPQDIAPLAAEVNLLLDANREVVDRARTQVGNLAHALKTPLSVILNEADAGSPTLAEKVKEQAEVMRRQVTFYLDRARAAARAGSIGSATEVKPVIEGLVAHLRQGLPGSRADFRHRRARRPALSRRSAGSDRSDRQSSRQCRQMGARARRHFGRARSQPRRRRARLFRHPDRRRRAGPRSAGADRGACAAARSSTNRGPAPGLACRSSSISRISTAARCCSRTARSAACARHCACRRCVSRGSP